MVDLAGYKLTFDDEFNTRSISQTGAGTTYADIRPDWRYDANSDIGFGRSSFVDSGSGYDPFSVQNGALSITAVPDRTSSGYPGSWESGLITTQGNFSQTYGYFEIRADFSNNPNAWDAFWMEPNQQTPSASNPGTWQELDVVEHYGNGDASVYSTIHTTDQQPAGVPWQSNRQVYSEMPNPSGYHTYGVNWQPDNLTFYVDGQKVGTQATPSDMHSPMYMMANLAVQSNASATGNPMSSSIDYIRAYSKDPNAVAVAQGTVSAPDGRDPGLYGATAATIGKTSAAQPTTGSSTGAVNASTGSSSTAAGPSESVTHTTSSPSPSGSSPTATTGTTSPTSGSTGVTSAASGSATGSVSTTGSIDTAAVTASTAGATNSATGANGMANTAGTSLTGAGTSSGVGPANGSTGMAIDPTNSTGSSHPVSVAAAPSSAQPATVSPTHASSTIGGASTTASGPPVGPSTSGSGATPQTATSSPTDLANPPSAAPPSVSVATGVGTQNISSSAGDNHAFQSYVASPAARAAALSAEKKIIKYAAKHPEAVGAANKMLEMFMHLW